MKKTTQHERTIFPPLEINRNFPSNIAEGDKLFFQQFLSGKSKATKIKIFNTVCLNNELFIKKRFSPRIEVESFGDAWQNRVYNNVGYQAKSLVKNFLRKNKKVDSALWCFDQFSTGGYFHWITEIGPRLWVAGKEVDPSFPLLIPEYFLMKWNFAGSFLKPFKRNIITFKENEQVFVNHLTFVSQTGGVFNYQPMPIKGSTALLKDYYYDSNYPLDLNQKIYISRNKTGKRTLLNERLIIELLKAFEFKVLYAEDLTLKDQINVFSRTSCLISLHGAGLSNMVFMPPNSKIIEIRHRENNNMLNFFFTLSHTFHHDYYYVFGDSKDDVMKNEIRPEDKSIHVEIDMLKSVLETISI